jgi:ATP-binding cassette subfamily F protein uup
MPLVALDRVSIAFGHMPLLDEVSFQIERGERVSVVGRNGAGKSTFLKLAGGEIEPDAGSVWRQPGTRIARLDQDVPLSSARTVSDIVGERHTAPRSADDEAWRREHQVDRILSRLNLQPDAIVDTLSGGWRRRVLLARALVGDPDLLLLDEPTNHLDIDAITWLEELIVDYPGAVVFVTHDRAFLQRVATRIVELDRGRLTSTPGDFATWLRRKEDALAVEAAQAGKLDRALAGEEAWLRQGIKARRTRNEGRVRALLALRAERAARREQTGNVRLAIEPAEASGRIVYEAKRISKYYPAPGEWDPNVTGFRADPPPLPVVRDFSTRIMRGDRVGLIGPNGAGKTTLLRLLLGEIAPDEGEVRRGANVQVAYYDQQREQLDPDATVFDTVGAGSDTITIDGRSRHVMGYLRDFLFPPERARSPVRALSGGERNRLLLARLFTRPANVLVLDEPTNDLDLETLELLEAQLVEWTGTLLLVSHDRVFLDDIVTSTLVFEGDGRVQEYVGGYTDWLRQRSVSRPAGLQLRPAASGRRADVQGRSDPASAPEHGARAKRKLSYNEQRELAALPARIDALEAEQRALNGRIAGAEFYREPATAISEALARQQQLELELLDAYERWHELESRG